VNYERVVDGAWVQPRPTAYLMACCDCHLVHVMQFRLQRGRIQLRAFRHDAETARLRSGSQPAEPLNRCHRCDQNKLCGNWDGVFLCQSCVGLIVAEWAVKREEFTELAR
jgi:hypothetical protein